MTSISPSASRFLTHRHAAPTRRRASHIALAFAAWCAAVMLGFIPVTKAQTVAHTENKADQSLKSSARVDPSTLGMGLDVPLGGLPGRAGTGLPISLSYSSKVWRINYISSHTTYLSTHTWSLPKFAEYSAAGWTTSLAPPRVEFTGVGQHYNYQGEPLGEDLEGGDPFETRYYIARINVHLPDGSSHELRKDHTARVFYTTYDFSGTFTSADGSRLRFECSTTGTNVLYLPDGSRYFFGPYTGGDLEPTQYIDRNGNTLTYNPSSRQWTDTLGRTINSPLPATPAWGDSTYTLPRVGGSTANYIFRWRYLSEVRTDPSQPLRYDGRHQCGSSYTAVSPYLFDSSYPNYVCTTGTFNPVVLSEVELPTQQKYRFTYNVYGEIDKVYYPTGGYERFRHEQVPPVSRMEAPYSHANRGVVERWVSPSGTGGDEARWEYGVTGTSSIVVYSVAPDGTRGERIIMGGGSGPPPSNSPPFGFDDARAGMILEERAYTAPDQYGNRQMLRRSLNEWSVSTVAVIDENGYSTGAAATRDPRITKEVGLILDTGGSALSSTTTYAHDADLNVTSTSRFDYASVDQTTAQTGAISSMPQGALVRTDEVTFLVNDTSIAQATRDAYRARNLTGLPSSSRVKNSAGAIVAQSYIRYDETNYPLLSEGAAAGWTDPQTNVRGNATTTGSWLDTTGTYIETHAQYNHHGSPRKTWDGRGNISETEYSSAYQYAYATLTRSAVPDPSGQYGTNTALTTSTAYDLSTGLVTSTTDANGKTTTFEYNDPLNRPKKVTRPDGGHMTYEYLSDSNGHYVRTQTKLNTAGTLTDAKQYVDGLGRESRAFNYDPQDGGSWQTVDTQYDAMGRVWRVSQPYRSTGPGSTINPSGRWTESTFDALGRVVQVKTTADNAVVTSSYSGNQVTVTDQNGRKRRSVPDALGRLTSVTEAPEVSPCQLDGAGCTTYYTYDALGNLRKVEQGGQLRFFMYDSLGRLIRAKNPEQAVNTALNLSDPVTGNSQWSLSYSYDAAGNLTTRTDARNIITSYAYDNLNRSKTVNFSDTALNVDVERHYDNPNAAANGRGRFWYDFAFTQGGARNEHVAIDNYDAAGRALNRRQHFYESGAWGWGPAYNTQYEYNLAGSITRVTYPSGRTADYTYDAAGRLSGFTGKLGDGTQRTYASEIRYHATGGMEQERFGTQTPVYNKSFYNVRGQLSEIRVSTHSIITAGQETNWNRGAIINHYSYNVWAGSDQYNNGNLKKQEIYIPNDDAITGYWHRAQFYYYDSLNRLDYVNESSSQSWQQDYMYDRWGNRTINATNTWGGVPEPQFDVDPANNNRLKVPSGQPGVMTYDNAGNLTGDTYTGQGTRTFDAEGRMTQAQWFDGQLRTASYVYDAEGRRVKRNNGLGVETWQVYGLGGELLAEYAAYAQPASPQKEYGYRGGELLVVADAAVNVALGKQATQSSNLVPSTPAGLAVDGNTSGDLWGGGSASATNANYQSWWQVDLGDLYQLSTVEVWSRSDCCNDHTANFYVFVSDSPFTSTDLTTTLNQAGVSNYYTSGYGGWPTTVAVNRTGRYVRVQRSDANYLIMGEVEVWSAGSGSVSAGGINWLVHDQLGTPRMVIDQTGALAGVKRHDYLPFGEELTVGGRTAAQGYVADTNRFKFTTYERDVETGLDYAQARYFAHAQGRFTSVDPLTASASIGNPQTFNRYSYALNSPYKFTDPSGMLSVDSTACGQFCSNGEANLKGDSGGALSGGNYWAGDEVYEEITVQLNMVYDRVTVGTEKAAIALICLELHDATIVFNTIGINLAITFTPGTATGNGEIKRGNQITEGRVEGALNVFISANRSEHSGEVTNSTRGEIFLNWGRGKGSDTRHSTPESGDLAHGMGHAFGIASKNSRIPFVNDINNLFDDSTIGSTNESLRQGKTTEYVPSKHLMAGLDNSGARGSYRELPAISKYREGARRYLKR